MGRRAALPICDPPPSEGPPGRSWGTCPQAPCYGEVAGNANLPRPWPGRTRSPFYSVTETDRRSDGPPQPGPASIHGRWNGLGIEVLPRAARAETRTYTCDEHPITYGSVRCPWRGGCSPGWQT